MEELELVSIASDEATELKDLAILSLHNLGSVRVSVAGNPHTPSLAFEYLIKDKEPEVILSLAGNPSLVEPYISQMLGTYCNDENLIDVLSKNVSLTVDNMKFIAERYPHIVKNFISNKNLPVETILIYFYSINSSLKDNPQLHSEVINNFIENPNTPLHILGFLSTLSIRYKFSVIEQVRITQPMLAHLSDEDMLSFLKKNDF